MSMFEFRIELAAEAAGPLEELLAESQEQRFMVLEDKVGQRAWLAGYFASRREAEAAWMEFREAVRPEWMIAAPSIQEMPDKNWKESYKEHFKAWRFGRLHWVPEWERTSFHVPAGEAVLWLDPGMAFGTGNHETTRLVVERLVEFAESSPRARVIDAGCGSGILALSAVKLGFRDVVGFDNDPLAVEVSRENAKLNGLAEEVQFMVADLKTGLATRRADLVLANIQADVLQQFAPELLHSVSPGGALVLSGILAHELGAVRMTFQQIAVGWTTKDHVMGEWSDLVLRRP